MLTHYSRRGFLKSLSLGVAGAMVAGTGGLAGVNLAAAQQSPPDGRFGRMFRLPPFAQPSPQMEAALRELGRPGGLLDAKDDLSNPVALITTPGLSVNNRNSPTHTAGTTFMGQFMDHDMTFDTTSRLGRPTAPEGTENLRTPAFDLDSVYGRGPTADPHLYDVTGLKFRIDSGGLYEDLPRGTEWSPRTGRTAIIADPRNDETVIIAGLHAAVLKFHNNAVEHVRPGSGDLFARARQLTTWHYQYMILHEFLPLFVGQAMVDDILTRGRRFYKPGHEAYIPVEFQGAAYRFGHSMVRPSYRANLGRPHGAHTFPPFFGLIFDPAEIVKNPLDPADMSGGARAPRRFVDWQTFFDFGDGEVKPNKRIDTKISSPLFSLPPGAIAGSSSPAALPQRTLLRQITWQLPSGQTIAQHMGVRVLTKTELQELSAFSLNLDQHTPLFYYLLKEAELIEDGLHLGPVGGRIVGEVIIGLLQTDPASYLSIVPNWTPTLPKAGSTFQMTDFLKFAGVDPATRRQ